MSLICSCSMCKSLKEMGFNHREWFWSTQRLLYCGSEIDTTYNDLYDYDWNLDVTVTPAICNKRRRIGLDANIVAAARLSVSGPNNPNFGVEMIRIIYSNTTRISTKKRHVCFYSSWNIIILLLLPLTKNTHSVKRNQLIFD